ncbi:type II toxin-antitoxin system PemK/MazF family toxin [Shigella boydii]
MGDLIWGDFDPTKASEASGHRPAVVLVRSCTTTNRYVSVCSLYNAIKSISVGSRFILVRNVMA